MNIAFFLIPKSEVVFLNENATMRQALERMEYHRWTAVPLVDNEGKYVGTLTEGDLLWTIKNYAVFSLLDAERVLIKDIDRHFQNQSVSINTELKDLIDLSIHQNFVPVADDDGTFIGIIRRREIIEYFSKMVFSK
ncbi:MAG: CBS domain-containing protein [Syntrophomonadaceae bacterium]|jgi:CBS domain-containing protein|nr:CBS domain-containing protein [Syntrophomonadaceae bacterium]